MAKSEIRNPKSEINSKSKIPNIKNILRDRVVILCLGNLDRGDDGAGSAIASAIKGKTYCEVIDAGVTPENYTGVIIKLKPDTIVIIDTVLFEGRPGEVRLFSGEDLRSGKISTHDVSPKLLIEYLRSSTNAKIYILGIRPKSNKLGETLSDEVKEAVDKITLHLSHAQGKVIDNIKDVC